MEGIALKLIIALILKLAALVNRPKRTRHGTDRGKITPMARKLPAGPPALLSPGYEKTPRLCLGQSR